MKTIRHSLMASCLTILLLSAYSTEGAGPLPEFTFEGVALHPESLSFAPTEQLVHPSIIKMEGRVKNPLDSSMLYIELGNEQMMGEGIPAYWGNCSKDGD